MKTKFKLFLSLFIFGVLFTNSCDTNIGLGARLNLDPPTVDIISPESMENISEDILTISGTASDEEMIVTINVSIESTKEDWKIEWQGTLGEWETVNTTISDYDGIIEAVWEGTGGDIQWSITTALPHAPEGEFIITAGAINNAKTSGPLLQRRVTIDLTEPVVKIVLPELSSIKTALDQYEIRNPAHLEKFHCTKLKIQYEIEDDFSIDTITIILKDDDKTYYEFLNTDAKWNGTLEIKKEDFIEPLPNTKTYLELVTIATDKAGNTTEEKKQGWLIWWPDATKPWAEGLGSTNSSVHSYVFPGSKVFGSSYGKYGIDTVKYELKTGLGTTVDDYSDTLENIPLQAGAEKSSFFNFTFEIPSPDERVNYRIDVTTTDINENATTDYFYIYSEPVSNLGPLMLSYEGSPSGTYGEGQSIDITINFREDVLVNTDSSLTLTDTNNASVVLTAPLFSGNGTSKLTYRYIVKPGDSVAFLSISSINYSSLTKPGPGGSNLPSPAVLNVSELNPLTFYTTITIRTDVPVLLAGGAGVSFNASTSVLTLTFNKDVYKGTGNIVITQQGDYLAPAVLTKAEYDKFGGQAILGNFYTVGTNGANEDWTQNTEEKYILDYDIATDDTSLRVALTGRNANKVIVPVASSAVSRSGSVLTIQLTEDSGYSPYVKGVNYDITYTEGIVIDNQNNKTPALVAGDRTFFVPGVNEPFIRVQKNREEVITTGSVEMPTISSYTWARYSNVNALTVGSSQSLPSENIGRIGIGDQNAFIGYRQSAPPTTGDYVGTYVNIKTLIFSETNGTGRFQGSSFHRSNTAISGNAYNYTVRWGAGDTVPGYMKIAEGNGHEVLTPAVNGMPGEDASPIWVSFVENSGVTVIDGENNSYGRAGVILYNVWGTSETVNQLTSPGDGYFRGNVSGYSTDSTRTANTMTARQPLTTNFKIDCQTPGAQIRYTTNGVETRPFAGPFNMSNHPRPVVVMPAEPITTSALYNAATPPSLGENNLSGNIYGIRAKAWAEDGTASSTANEIASRSVIMFRNITEARFWNDGDNNLNGQLSGAEKLHLWIRGGDNPTGQNSTPGFPLSWSDTDYSGIRLMTSPADSSSDTGTWYWVSWEVSAPAYFHFIAGSTPRTTGATDIRDNGPQKWSWGKNNWAFQNPEYILYPGGALLFSRDTIVSSPATDRFEFYNSFSGSRP